MRAFILISFLLPAIVYAQTTGRSLTVTATDTSLPVADQVLLSVSLSAALDQGLDDVLKALAQVGISANALSDVRSTMVSTSTSANACVDGLQWTFALTVPQAKLKDTLTTLQVVQRQISNAATGAVMNFYVTGIGASAASQRCSMSTLIAKARAQAQTIANSTGASIGPVLALSDGSVALGSNAYVLPTNAVRTGDFSSAYPVISSGCNGGTIATTGSAFFDATTTFCTAVVKFSLLPATGQ